MRRIINVCVKMPVLNQKNVLFLKTHFKYVHVFAVTDSSSDG